MGDFEKEFYPSFKYFFLEFCASFLLDFIILLRCAESFM